jgi:Response regulator containing CheY-like receiver, AAA-type ATPase, and DNA-binding domains
MRRILVVDDEDGIRRALRTVLERAGYEVREARTGQDAVRLWREEQGDLVITDIHMPDKDGIETILELRALSPNLPIIAVSGSGERRCRDLLRDANLLGTIRTLDKPFRLTEVLECVSEVIESGGWREGRA